MRPDTVQEAARLLKDRKAPIRPIGGGTKPWIASHDEEVLETGALDRILEHNVGDFTAILEAGVPFADAQRAFAEHGQRLAWDPPDPGGATIGGIVATADSGPLRHRYGGVRDLIVGINLVLSDGTIAKAGGKVIKNVAGYDLAKLFAGSFGTLGLIASVSVRLHPLPEQTATVVIERDDPDELLAVVLEHARRPLEADCFDVVWRDGRGRLLLQFSGASAREQAERVGDVADVDWGDVRALQRGPVVLKVSGRPTDLPNVIRTASKHGATVISRAALGLSWLAFERPEPVAAVREALAPRNCTVLDGADRVQDQWPGDVPGQVVMERLKARFDPARIFRPGAFVGGLWTAWDLDRHPPELDLIRDCVHCGFCLTTCPSYAVFEDEMDSPRGRIVLMRVGHEEAEEISPEMVTHFDRCLGCMACVTACPSGVQYDKLIERVRPQIEHSAARSWQERAYRKAIFAVMTHPARLRALAPGAKLGPKLAPLVPVERLKTLLSLAPAKASYRPLPKHKESKAPIKRGTVAFMQGCVQRVFFGDVNAATVRVLSAEGWEVHSPRSPRCCGALQMHSGVDEEAIPLAWATIEAYEGFDKIVTNVAGCGSVMKDYGHILDDDRAREFSAKVVDVHELLASEEQQAVRKPIELRAAYHDACHLAHAQKIRSQPRELLRGIPGLELLEPQEWELCCGSAGIYNLLQPEAAEKLGTRKAENLRATGADAIAAANPGCALQIARHLDLPIYHPMTLLDMSLRGVKP